MCLMDKVADSKIRTNQNLTLYYISDFGGIVREHIILYNVTKITYAQYDDAIRIEYKIPKKRKVFYKEFYNKLSCRYSDSINLKKWENYITLLIYDGHIKEPITVLYDIEEKETMTIKTGKFKSFDNRQFEEIQKYFINSTATIPIFEF